jgi:hypothetical protein
MEEEKILEGYSHYKVACQDVRIYDSHVEIKLPTGMTKTIGIGDFLTTLSKTINQEDNLKTTLFPANCYIFGQSITEMKLACYYPGKLREITFIPRGVHTPTPMTFVIPFPNIVISHQLKRNTDGWEHQHSRYYATTKTMGQLENKFLWEKNEQEGIWVLPFPNIYPEGRLCHGANTLLKGPFRDNFRGLDWHFAVLHNSPFNDDLQIPSIVKSSRGTAYFTELSTHKTFPYELLVHGKKQASAGRSVALDIMDENQAEFRPIQGQHQDPPILTTTAPAATWIRTTTQGVEAGLGTTPAPVAAGGAGGGGGWNGAAGVGNGGAGGLGGDGGRIEQLINILPQYTQAVPIEATLAALFGPHDPTITDTDTNGNP